MKLNATETKTMIVSRSGAMHPKSPPLTIGGAVLKASDELFILGLTFDSIQDYFCEGLRRFPEQLLKDLVY